MQLYIFFQIYLLIVSGPFAEVLRRVRRRNQKKNYYFCFKFCIIIFRFTIKIQPPDCVKNTKMRVRMLKSNHATVVNLDIWGLLGGEPHFFVPPPHNPQSPLVISCKPFACLPKPATLLFSNSLGLYPLYYYNCSLKN